MNHHILDAAAIVSGSDVPHDHYDSSSDDDAQVPIQDRDPTEVDMNHSDTDEEAESTKYNIPSKDELYNPNEDEEDEAYVYQHLRGGTEESISIRRKKKENTELEINNGNADANSDKKNCMSAGKEIPNKSTHGSSEQYQHSLTLEQAKVLKPRSSDAVLSCPCCFQIVCMDCQRHERYGNQFRAMFVMNIGVSWDKYISPGNLDNKKEADADVSMDTDVTARPALKKPRNQEDTSGSVTIPLHEAKGDSVTEDPKRDEYFSIHCSNCNTEVAALDMSDEVYHFFGCLVSA